MDEPFMEEATFGRAQCLEFVSSTGASPGCQRKVCAAPGSAMGQRFASAGRIQLFDRASRGRNRIVTKRGWETQFDCDAIHDFPRRPARDQSTVTAERGRRMVRRFHGAQY